MSEFMQEILLLFLPPTRKHQKWKFNKWCEEDDTLLFSLLHLSSGSEVNHDHFRGEGGAESAI